MEYRKFGKTGIDISAIGFGCWEIGGGYGSIEETDFIKAIGRALDAGINSFDTAEAYGFGASEKSLAKALGKRRKEAVITTKFGVGYPDTPNYRDSTRKRVWIRSKRASKHLRPTTSTFTSSTGPIEMCRSKSRCARSTISSSKARSRRSGYPTSS